MINTKTLKMQCQLGFEHGVDWYARANRTLIELAELCQVSNSEMAILLAGYSPRVSVLRSVKLAIEYTQTGQRPAGSMRSVHKSTMLGLERGFLNGPKTENFRQALLGVGDALVLDVWACRGLAVDQSKAYQKRFFPRIRRRFESVAESFGISVAQTQACQWSGVMKAHGRNDLDLLNKPTNQVFESVVNALP